LIGNKKLWGKGVGFEAWTLMINFLFTQCNVRKVTGGALDVNVAMSGIIEKSIMTQEATKKNQKLFNNKLVNVFYFCNFFNDK